MASDLNSSKRTIVPWFSMREWEEVYKQVYSGELSQVQRGYEQMRVWKTRLPSLPAGIECTLSLIHVWLQDRADRLDCASGSLPPYSEHNLRLMLSTAIMRFLNQISIVAQEGLETMYKMAKKLHIPDWVVTIRHDVAHGLSMPPLVVLREAMQFCLIWINEHYWRREVDFTRNYVVNTNNPESTDLICNVLEHIELWQALKLYQHSGHEDVNNIPDNTLKLQLKRRIENNLKEGYEMIQTGDAFHSSGDNHLYTLQMNNWKTTDLLDQIIAHLESLLVANVEELDCVALVNRIVESETFIPERTIMAALYTDNEKKRNALPMQLRHLWEDVLKVLQSGNILLVLLQRLIDEISTKDDVYRQRLAAIWMKELCLGIAKVQKCKVFMDQYEEMCIEKNIAKLKRKKIYWEFEKLHPELTNVILLKSTHLPNINRDFVEEVALTPNKWMSIYFPSLLDLVHPALAAPIKKALVSLITIYTDEEQHSPEGDNEMYTVEMLEKDCGVEEGRRPDTAVADITPAEPDNVANTDQDNSSKLNEQDMDTWVQCKAEEVWENCPLGVLPWQREMECVDFSLPSSVVWTSVHPVTNPSSWEDDLSLPTHKIDWEEIKQSKRSKKQKRSELGLVKNAFKAAGFNRKQSNLLCK